MKKYVFPEHVDVSLLEELIQSVKSTAAARFLYQRGIKTQSDLSEWIEPQKKEIKNDIFDIESATKLLKQHLDNKNKICVYGDYDVDGLVAASTMWRFLNKRCKADATAYIPNRHEEGYGLNNEALAELHKQGVKLVITVDCGIRDVDLIATWKEKGLDIIVTDHHQPGASIPDTILVHPLYPDKESQNKFTSGSVVVWKWIRVLEQEFKTEAPNLSDELIDLIGLSLITDIMPVTGENRLILMKALEKASTDPTLAVSTILKKAEVHDKVTPFHFGYVIGPRLNSSGRIADAYTTLRLLSSDKEEYVRTLANEIEEVNTKRQWTMKGTIEEADKSKVMVNNAVIVAFGENWDDGVIGLVAGRLMNKYDMPTIVMTRERTTGLLKGSARSITNLNITELLDGFKDELLKYGGHHAAAGFTAKEKDFTAFVNKLTDYVKEKYGSYNPEQVRYIDISLEPHEVTWELLHVLQILEPYGPENLAPVIHIKGTIDQFQLVGKTGTHAKIVLGGLQGTIDCMFFNCEASLTELRQGSEINAIGKIKEDTFMNNHRLQFIIDDLINL